MAQAIIKGLFENGLMGIETPADLSGSECSFTSAVIAVEELAKVDASVAVLCDVHNTLVNSVIRMYANDAIKEKWLPGLATDTVSSVLTMLTSGGKFLSHRAQRRQ
jgi:alkylation response protein AidB-like acyl-CoA dehydrogenase